VETQALHRDKAQVAHRDWISELVLFSDPDASGGEAMSLVVKAKSRRFGSFVLYPRRRIDCSWNSTRLI